MATEVEIRITGRDDATPALRQVESGILGIKDIALATFAGNLMTSAFNTFLSGIRGIGNAIQDALSAMGNAIADVFNEAAKAELIEAQLDAVLKSTKSAAGMTKDALLELAGSLSQLTVFEDDAILAAENMLLTFTNVGEEVFPQATEAILDMATSLAGGAIPTGEQLIGVTQMLGKALNDPIQGLTALKRVGVGFTETETEMIAGLVEGGRTMEAQKIILGELSREFGGSAVMMGQTTLGAVQRLQNGFGEMKESLVKTVMPTVNEFALTTVNAFQDPRLQAAWNGFVNGIKATIDPVFTRLSNQFQQTANIITDAIERGDWGAAIDAMLDFIAGREGVIASVGGLITRFGRKLIDTLKNEWPKVQEALRPWTDKFWVWLVGEDGNSGALGKAGEYVKKLMDWFMKKLNEYVQSESFQNGLRQIGLSISKAILDVIAPINPLAGVSSMAIGGFQTLTAGTSTSTPTNPTSAPQASAQWQAAGTQSEALTQYNAFLRRRQEADTESEIYTANQGISFWKNRLHELGVAGFQHGGVVPGPMGKPQLAVVHGGEQIVPPATNIYVTANYRNYQSESSLRDDLRLLQRLGATV